METLCAPSTAAAMEAAFCQACAHVTPAGRAWLVRCGSSLLSLDAGLHVHLHQLSGHIS